jgi:subtilase family protein/TIR domain-containing protein
MRKPAKKATRKSAKKAPTRRHGANSTIPAALGSTSPMRAEEARQKFKVEGDGIVWALLGTGVHRNHVHFAKHKNLVLPPPLHHVDFSAPKLPKDLQEQEALVDLHGVGTHEAGVICGEFTGEIDGQTAVGVAPKCKVLSIKVFDEIGASSDRQILSALNWIVSVNRGHDVPLIHGVMIDAGLRPDVRNFPCGMSPICEAVNELVRAGVVAVVPAGNNGYRDDTTAPPGSLFSSITDPGNAELAITVGATHWRYPHDYGASYFSSRGPTLDGRIKPDILAPGEKILSCWVDRETPLSKDADEVGSEAADPINASYMKIDGTAMAAAHVSGAVALLLSARPELIGRPLDVKRLIMKTAIDLKRIPWAQGSGLIDAFSLIERAQEALREVAPPQIRAGSRPSTTGFTEVKATLPEGAGAPASVAAGGKRFVFSFSYPGTHRDLVSNVVYTLRRSARLARDQILFDRFHEAELARPDLGTYLPKLYENESELVIVFLGGDYARSKWCGLEWEVIQNVIERGEGHNVMPLRLDAAEVPGLKWTDGFMDVSDRDPEEIAAKIAERLKLNRKDAKPE